MKLIPLTTKVDGVVLRGTIHAPEHAPHPTPGAVLFHGFGGNRIDFSGFMVQVARGLVERGCTVVTYDRAGHGESDGEFFDTSVTRDIRHAHAVLADVAALPQVDAAAGLHLGGLSLGAVIAACVAAESPLPIASLSLWSNAAVFVDEIRGGTIQGRSLQTLDTVGYFDFLGMRMGRAMVDDAASFDPYGRAAEYGGPALVMHGTSDFVPVEYARRYAELWGDQADLRIVEDADHGWATVPHRELLVETTASFVSAHAQAVR
ncbi:alpha/beta hydrolase [Brachybacterium sp. J144]|uniref:alpha/beta hydrolase n=1 Tax=Brachybacterium sp. J144 TaxID=3116487 RepID=UPI002E77DCE0|nr:alpha/beta hydrolase [Brachybacterium sp. J144]MEE1651031.1 alpha/beta hydrolase [Brachybacterium sp. J144]